MSTQPPLESAAADPPGDGVRGHPNGAHTGGAGKAPLTSFFFNTTGPVNRLDLHRHADPAFQRMTTCSTRCNGPTPRKRRSSPRCPERSSPRPERTTPYTITGVRLQARGPVFNDDLAFLGVECAYTVEYTIRR